MRDHKSNQTQTQTATTSPIETKGRSAGHGAALFSTVFAALVLSSCLLLAGCASSAPSSSASSSSESFTSTPSDLSGDANAITNALSFEVEGMTWDPAILANAQAQNPDVYAWLYVPGTGVNHPLLQNAEEIDFYLVHDINGNSSGTGELYSQSIYNSKDFKDPVTLIYGHTYEYGSGWENEMFSTLHNFEDKDFFDTHEYFYVFTPDKILQYQIVSAYEYENRHVLYSFDFSQPTVLQQYFDYVVNPESAVKNTREGVKLEAGKDHIVQLATCTRPANDAYRYLVTGALVNGRTI